MEEIETFLRTPEELSNLDDDYYDTEGDILYLEKLLNEDPSPTLPPMKNDKLKQVDVTITKPSIEEPPELELKDLPSHLEYAFLEGTDKLPVIISKEFKDEEKAALLKVLKSHKRAITWKIFDIKGIDPSFCTHKILMEDDFKPAVQHQRRVNLKIHEVIKKVVIKLLDAELIYPISDSLWVGPVHCVPKKGGMTVVENKDNELIPTRSIIDSFLVFNLFNEERFIMDEIETFLRTPEELSNLDDDYYDTEGDILYLEKLLNEDPSPTLPPMKNDKLKQVDVTITKPSIEEPPELELKDLPSHLEYAFLEGTDKLPVIISKEFN
ncbi:hypothetical protein Tco_0747540 [Tanacetum coccineum]|uniref:Reverse transcriptase domain-containing protein n=1 Tax=Tanacetum coccineum TaxID=301880 RepID=A0ABQ4YT46_9ASTR